MQHDEDIPVVARGTVATVAGGAVQVGPLARVNDPEAGDRDGLLDGGGAVASAGAEGGAAEAPGQVGRQEQAPRPEPAQPPRRARAAAERDGAQQPKGKRQPNNVRRLRIERMMSKAELARRANLSVLTIDRVEKGYGCRMDSKRKILEALGLSLADRVRVFGEEE